MSKLKGKHAAVLPARRRRGVGQPFANHHQGYGYVFERGERVLHMYQPKYHAGLSQVWSCATTRLESRHGRCTTQERHIWCLRETPVTPGGEWLPPPALTAFVRWNATVSYYCSHQVGAGERRRNQRLHHAVPFVDPSVSASASTPVRNASIAGAETPTLIDTAVRPASVPSLSVRTRALSPVACCQQHTIVSSCRSGNGVCRLRLDLLFCFCAEP